MSRDHCIVSAKSWAKISDDISESILAFNRICPINDFNDSGKVRELGMPYEIASQRAPDSKKFVVVVRR